MPNADTKILWPRCETKYCVYRMTNLFHKMLYWVKYSNVVKSLRASHGFNLIGQPKCSVLIIYFTVHTNCIWKKDCFRNWPMTRSSQPKLICTKLYILFIIKLNPAFQSLLSCGILLSLLCLSPQVKYQQISKLCASIIKVTHKIWNEFIKCWFSKIVLGIDKHVCFCFLRCRKKRVTYFA